MTYQQVLTRTAMILCCLISLPIYVKIVLDWILCRNLKFESGG